MPISPYRYRFVPVVAAALLLGACSVATPPSVAVALRPAAPPTSVRLDPAPPADEAASRFTATFVQALGRHGVSVAPNSPTTVTIALSERPAVIGVTQQPGQAWLSAPRKHGPLDACRAQRLAVRIVARRDDSPEPAFSAAGGFDYCRLDAADLDRLAEQFAAELSGA